MKAANSTPGKRGAKKRAQTRTDVVQRKQDKKAPPAWATLRGAIFGLLLTIVVLPGYSFFRGSAGYAVPLVVGAVLGLITASYLEALVGSGVFGVLLAAVAPVWLRYPAVATALNAAGTTREDINAHLIAVNTTAIFNRVWLPAVRGATLATETPGLRLVLGVGVCAAIACGVLYVRRSGWIDRIAPALRARFNLGTGEQLAGRVLMCLVLTGLVLSAGTAAVDFNRTVDQYLEKGAYASDYIIYVRTIQDMARGNSYYASLKSATEDDFRAAQPDHYRMPKASWVRMPVLPTALAVLGGKKLSRDVFFGLLLGAIAIGFVGWSFEKQLSPGAGTVVALLVMPYFAMTGTWEPAFLPDYWGGILVLLAFGLLLNRLTYPAIAVSLLAALTREHIWLWVFALLLGFVWLGLARKRWRPAGVTAGGFALVVAAYATHWHAVNTKYAWLLSGTATGSGLLGVTAAWTGLGPSLARLNTVADFAIAPYTLYRFSSVFLILAAAAFLIWRLARALRAQRVAVAELSALVFIGLMAAAILAQGYFSQYWAVMFMPLALAACAGLIGEFVKATQGLGAGGTT